MAIQPPAVDPLEGGFPHCACFPEPQKGPWRAALGLASLDESLLIRGKFSYAAGHHKYQKVQYLSAGSYGFVVLAVDKDNGDLVSFGGPSFAQQKSC
jgi:hypothetical protein